MTKTFQLELVHLRLLWLIERHPEGITALRLIEELKARGWCEPDLTPADLDLDPEDVLAVNDAAAEPSG